MGILHKTVSVVRSLSDEFNKSAAPFSEAELTCALKLGARLSPHVGSPTFDVFTLLAKYPNLTAATINRPSTILKRVEFAVDVVATDVTQVLMIRAVPNMNSPNRMGTKPPTSPQLSASLPTLNAENVMSEMRAKINCVFGSLRSLDLVKGKVKTNGRDIDAWYCRLIFASDTPEYSQFKVGIPNFFEDFLGDDIVVSGFRPNAVGLLPDGNNHHFIPAIDIMPDDTHIVYFPDQLRVYHGEILPNSACDRGDQGALIYCTSEADVKLALGEMQLLWRDQWGSGR